MRQPALMGNWKMNKDLSSATGFVEEFFRFAPDVSGRIDVVLFPPYPLIRSVCEAIRKGTRWSDFVEVGAQDIYPSEPGAYTGAVHGLCLRSVGATTVIVGHSERRNIFGDTDRIVNEKLHASLAMNLNPVLCVGENLEIRDEGRQDEFVVEQLEKAFSDVESEQMTTVTIAYEPIWAIGTGRTATVKEVGPVISTIRGWADKSGYPGGSESLRVLYGGSVTPDNSTELFAVDGIDGFLVGGASLDPFNFSAILESMDERNNSR